jgi:hypothetical protein
VGVPQGLDRVEADGAQTAISRIVAVIGRSVSLLFAFGVFVGSFLAGALTCDPCTTDERSWTTYYAASEWTEMIYLGLAVLCLALVTAVASGRGYHRAAALCLAAQALLSFRLAWLLHVSDHDTVVTWTAMSCATGLLMVLVAPGSNRRGRRGTAQSGPEPYSRGPETTKPAR